VNDWFNESVIWRVRSRNHIKFWKDKWIGDRRLQEEYPRLYANTKIK